MPPERIQNHQSIPNPVNTIVDLNHRITQNKGAQWRQMEVDERRYDVELFSQTLIQLNPNANNFYEALRGLRTPGTQGDPQMKQFADQINYQLIIILQQHLQAKNGNFGDVISDRNLQPIVEHLLQCSISGKLNPVYGHDKAVFNNLIPAMQQIIPHMVPANISGIDPAIRNQLENERLAAIKGEEFQNTGGSYYQIQEAEEAKRILKGGVPKIESAIMAIQVRPDATSVEQGLTRVVKKMTDIFPRWKTLLGGIEKFSRFSRASLSTAIGGIKDMLGRIDQAGFETHHIEKFIQHRYQIDIASPEFQKSFSISVADILNKYESDEEITYTISNVDSHRYGETYTRKIREAIMSHDSYERSALNEAVVLKIISEKTNLTKEQIKSLKHSNLHDPIGEIDIDKNGASYMRIQSIKDRNVKNYHGLKWYMTGLTDSAQSALALTGRFKYIDPLIDGYFPYAQRNPLLGTRYADMYNIGLAEARKYIFAKYGSFFATNIDKMHPLLIANPSRHFDIRQNASSDAVVNERKEHLQWILKAYNLSDQYKIAEDIIAGTASQDYFYDPVSGKRTELRTQRQKLDFLREHRESIGEMGSIDYTLKKFNGMVNTYGSEFTQTWAGVDFTNMIKKAMKLHGYDQEAINAFTRDRSNCVGHIGLKNVLKNGGYNILELNNEYNPANDLSKYWRYLAGVEAAMPVYYQIFAAFNASALDQDKIDDELIVGLIETASAETAKLLSELPPMFGHMGSNDHKMIIESMVRGLIELSVRKNHPAHRMRSVKNGSNEFIIPLRENASVNQQNLNELGFYVTQRPNGKTAIIAGNHGVHETWLDTSGKNPAIKEQFGSRVMTRKAFEEIIDTLLDKGLITIEASYEFRTKYSSYFDKLYENRVESVKKTGETFLTGALGQVIDVLDKLGA